MTENLSNYEKIALESFGSFSQIDTISNLYTVATLTNHKDDQKKLNCLAGKIAAEPSEDVYMNEFEKNAEDVERLKASCREDYQDATGDMETERPWENFLMVMLVDSFCSEDMLFDDYRLNMLLTFTPNPEMREALENLLEKLGNFGRHDQDRERRKDFLQCNRYLAMKARFRKKEGINDFNLFIYFMPGMEVRPFESLKYEI